MSLASIVAVRIGGWVCVSIPRADAGCECF